MFHIANFKLYEYLNVKQQGLHNQCISIKNLLKNHIANTLLFFQHKEMKPHTYTFYIKKYA